MKLQQPSTFTKTSFCLFQCDRGSLVDKVMDSWPVCHEFETSTAEDPPFKVKRSNGRLADIPLCSKRCRMMRVNTKRCVTVGICVDLVLVMRLRELSLPCAQSPYHRVQ
ncbi:hypothetical protein TNCV_3654241 [Trichonephila clavipes]|nr:hypothetical protein TNCV_3654241 [Trichonephila clavipes]